MDRRIVLENIYKQHFNLFVSIGVKYRLDKRAIEDMMHDAFVKAFVHHEKIITDQESGVRSYVIRIFRNECINYLRQAKNFLVSDAPFSDNAEMTTEDIRCDILHEILLIEEMKLRDRAIEKLHPAKYRDPVRLYLEGHQPKDIAEMLKINRSTTRNLIQRGLVKFEDMMNTLDPMRNN